MFPAKKYIPLFLGVSVAFGVSDTFAQSARDMLLREMGEQSFSARAAREAREKQLQMELLEYEANERKLELQSRQEMLQMESLKRKDSTSALVELSKLDPSSDEYPAKEASILAEYPLAITSLEVRAVLKANAQRYQRESPSPEFETFGSAPDFDHKTAEISQQQQAQRQTDEQRRQFNELKRLQSEQLKLLENQAEEIESLKGKLDEVEDGVLR